MILLHIQLPSRKDSFAGLSVCHRSCTDSLCPIIRERFYSILNSSGILKGIFLSFYSLLSLYKAPKVSLAWSSPWCHWQFRYASLCIMSGGFPRSSQGLIIYPCWLGSFLWLVNSRLQFKFIKQAQQLSSAIDSKTNHQKRDRFWCERQNFWLIVGHQTNFPKDKLMFE